MRPTRGVLFASALAGFISLAAMGSATAADYYVAGQDPRASDTNPGTDALPWKTLYRAAQADLKPGDNVNVKPANYDFPTGGSWSSPIINPKNSGTADRPITFRAVPRHGAVLQNAVNPIMGSAGRNYVVVDGFVVRNVKNKGVVVFGNGKTSRVKGVVIQNNIIEHIWLEHPTDNTDGVRLEYTDGVIVRNNVIRDVHNGQSTYNAAGVKLYSTSRTLIENNEIYDAGAGIYDKAGGQYNVIRRNHIHNSGDGIRVHSSTDTGPADHNQVYQNVVNKCGTGFAITDSIDKTLMVYNNVFANFSTALKGPGSATGRHRFYNNIMYSPKAGAQAVYAYDDPLVTMTTDYNLFVGEPSFIIGRYKTNRSFNSLSAWQSSVGLDTHSIVGDAGFVNAATGDFHLKPTSPAKAAGRAGGVAGGSPIDMGAYPLGVERIGLIPDTRAPAAPVLIDLK